MKRRRDYQRKDFKNPFFPKKNQSKKTKRTKFLVFILFIVVIFSLYFLNSVDQLQIKIIIVEGNERISQQEIRDIILDQLEKRRWLIFDQGNILFFSQRQVRRELNQSYLFEELTIKKKYFDTIVIKVKEQIASAVWVTAGEQYYLDSNGSAIRKIESGDLVVQTGEGGVEVIRPEASASRYPVVWDQSNDSVGIGQPIITIDQLNFVVALNNQLTQAADFDISHYNVANAKARDIILVTKEGWEAYFTFNDSAKDQVDFLFSVLQQKIKNRQDLEYVDLRFGEKVFWK